MKIYVVQYEHGGIPDEPDLILNELDAIRRWEQLATSNQGYRPMGEGENFGDYLMEYQEWFDEIPDQYSEFNFDPEDTCRIWELDMPEDPDTISIKWGVEDVIHRAREINDIEEDDEADHSGVVPTREQAREILQLVDRRHDCNYGVTWETLDYATEQYFEDLKKNKDF